MKKDELILKVKETIIEALDLNIKPEDIGDDDPLFGDGKTEGLFDNSLAVLEVTSALISEFDIDPSDFNNQSFSTIRSLANSVRNALEKK